MADQINHVQDNSHCWELILVDYLIIVDLCALASGCLTRGEMETPLHIFSLLFQSGKLPYGVGRCYFRCAWKKELCIDEAMEKLDNFVDTSQLEWVSLFSAIWLVDIILSLFCSLLNIAVTYLFFFGLVNYCQMKLVS